MMYYCIKCKKRVMAVIPGEFRHPHLGIKSCYVCLCGGMVCKVESLIEEG